MPRDVACHCQASPSQNIYFFWPGDWREYSTLLKLQSNYPPQVSLYSVRLSTKAIFSTYWEPIYIIGQ